MTEQNKYLAEHLFNPAIMNLAIRELQATEELRMDINNKEAKTKLIKTLDMVITAVTVYIFGPSPELSDEENDQYIALKRKKFGERQSETFDCFEEIKLSNEEESVYQRLLAKIDGRDF